MTVLAVGQMTATASLDDNLATCATLAAEAAARGAGLLALPECFSFMGEKDRDVLDVAEPLDGPRLAQYRALAQTHGLWLSLGGFQERGPDGDHIYNTHVIIDDSGRIVAHYRKVHLFDVDIPGGPKLLESNGTAPGDTLVACASPVGRLGLSICYDLRFPAHFASLADAGAEVLLVPAAFTLETGKEHWEPLLRARAIENQCYVAAPAQRGRHNPRRHSFGHAMIIDPWGTIVAQCPDETSLCTAPIAPEALARVRTRMPVARHRRDDVYARPVTIVES